MPSSKLPNWFFSFLNFWCISLTKPYEYARVGVALLHRVVDQGVSKCPARWCMWSFALDRSVQNPFESFCILQNPSKSLQIFNFPNPLGLGLFWLQPIGIASVALLLSNRSHDQKTANHTEAQLHKDWSTSLHLGSQQPMHSATENLGPSKAVGSWVVSSSKCHFPPEIHLSSFFKKALRIHMSCPLSPLRKVCSWFSLVGMWNWRTEAHWGLTPMCQSPFAPSQKSMQHPRSFKQLTQPKHTKANIST